MIRPMSGLLAILLASAALSAVPLKSPLARPVLITGTVEAVDSQAFSVPYSDSSPVVLRNYVDEGASVKAGQVVLRIENTSSANIERQQNDLKQAQARVERETANLDVSAIEARKNFVKARAELAKAKVEAALPKMQIGGLRYDRFQANLENTLRDLSVKQEQFDNAQRALERRRQDGELEIKKLQVGLAFQLAKQKTSEVVAERDGIVIHGYGGVKGERLDEGSSSWPGNYAGTVLGEGKMRVAAWALEADRPLLNVGQNLDVRFDALPGKQAQGKLVSIAGAPESRPNWGTGRYFRLVVDLPDTKGMMLVSGMSAMLEPQGAKPGKLAAPAAKAGELKLEGEITSRANFAIAPPSINQVWRFKLAMLQPEGRLVKAGELVARFETEEVGLRLGNENSSLAERSRSLDKLKLDQAEAEKAGEVALAEAVSNAEKAQRKAEQPAELVRRVDYDKQTIDKAMYAELAQLTQTQRKAQAVARRAERSSLEADIANTRATIARLEAGRVSMEVRAPRAGLVQHRTGFNDERFEIGAQVWRGISVATVADPEQLFVQARVSEAQASAVRVGQSARVTVSGENQSWPAKVVALGRSFHSKSTAQSSIVRDMELQFDSPPKGLKPGAAVQAVLLAEKSK